MNTNIKIIITCEEYKHKKIINDKIIIDEPTEEYYIIPLTKSFNMEHDGEVFQLTFKNQLLWLKYSNHNKEILLKDNTFSECIIIKSENILDIYMKVSTNNYFRKNVWSSKNNLRLNSRYDGRTMLMIPVIDDMIKIREFGEGIVKEYQMELISNEVLVEKTISHEHNCSLMLTNNFLLNKEAVFIRLDDESASSFFN